MLKRRRLELSSGLESVASDEVSVERGRRLGSARTSRVGEIHLVKSEAFREANRPLEVVE